MYKKSVREIRSLIAWTIAISFIMVLHGFLFVQDETSVRCHPTTRPAVVDMQTGMSNRTTPAAIRVIPVQPFDRHEPTMVVILTYQRCGSSFFGQLFNTNRDAFYMYEPLDSLYSALYGTNLGWNVPSDITNHPNGSVRTLSREELGAVSEFLWNVLSCDVDSIPTQTLINRFLYNVPKQFALLGKYIRCLKLRGLKYSKCEKFTSEYCGSRFGENSVDVQSECFQVLAGNPPESRNQNQSASFEYGSACWDRMRRKLNQTCQPLFTEICRTRSMRVTKVVRATMESMQPLLETKTNFRVIHFLRDPRAVVLSRRNYHESARGLYTDQNRNETFVREARLYCQTAARDVIVRRDLEKLYPGKIYSLFYEDLVTDLIGYSEEIYSFLNSTLHRYTRTWIRDNELNGADEDGRTSVDVANKWKNELTVQQSDEIMAECQEFFQLINRST